MASDTLTVDLDEFTQGYIECALWASTDDNGTPLDDLGAELTEAAQLRMESDCRDFVTANKTTLLLAIALTRENAKALGHDYSVSFLGHDFWLTRNRHGAGFWDRGLGEVGKVLTDAAHAYGECNLYVTDGGKIEVA